MLKNLQPNLESSLDNREYTLYSLNFLLHEGRTKSVSKKKVFEMNTGSLNFPANDFFVALY